MSPLHSGNRLVASCREACLPGAGSAGTAGRGCRTSEDKVTHPHHTPGGSPQAMLTAHMVVDGVGSYEAVDPADNAWSAITQGPVLYPCRPTI